METLKLKIGICPISIAPVKESNFVNRKFVANFRFWRQYDLRKVRDKDLTMHDFTMQLWCRLAKRIKEEIGGHVDLDDEMHTSFDVTIPTSTTPEKQTEIEETVIRLIKEIYPLGDPKVEIARGRGLTDWS